MEVGNGVYDVIFLPLFEKYGNLMRLCIVMMAIDFITGILASVKAKTFSWKKAGDGLCRKLATLVVIFIIAAADYAMPVLSEELLDKFEIIDVIWPTVTASYTFHDICSAMLNVDQFGNGVLPKELRRLLKFFVPNRDNENSTISA